MKPNETDKFNPSYWRGETGFFDKLLRLPLFQGIGRNDFLEIAERVRLGFRKVTRETTLVQQDEPCNSLIFVMRGGIRTSRESDAHTYTLAEWINQPLVISPESLFGLHPRYTHKVVVSESAEILQIDKAAVRDILFDYPTFRINFLNILSGRLQRSSHLLWRPLPTIPEQCFTHFFTGALSAPRRPQTTAHQNATTGSRVAGHATECFGHVAPSGRTPTHPLGARTDRRARLGTSHTRSLKLLSHTYL